MSQIERDRKKQEERAAQMLAQLDLRWRLRERPIAVAVRQILRKWSKWNKPAAPA
ncbi:MAG: hypothetical protein ABIH03_15505 [Pseudomonadota bacterium]